MRNGKKQQQKVDYVHNYIYKWQSKNSEQEKYFCFFFQNSLSWLVLQQLQLQRNLKIVCISQSLINYWFYNVFCTSFLEIMNIFLLSFIQSNLTLTCRDFKILFESILFNPKESFSSFIASFDKVNNKRNTSTYDNSIQFCINLQNDFHFILKYIFNKWFKRN